ncbi:MAG TPA: hypothetical protein VMM60_15665 [Ilumatobacter sp.]|nr:hypothetical protein [Ilumatobacter sp.]
MDVDWAESQVPSAELRVGERMPGFPARLTLAQAATTELNGSDRDPGESPAAVAVDESASLCSSEACVLARSKAREPDVVRVEFDVDALSAAFATALVTALDGRELSSPLRSPVVQHPTPVAAPKGSFWAGAWHADVVLSAIAILVIVVVLLAWTV